MTDPLSITVGILAIAGACSAGVKLLRSTHTSSHELVHLANELEHLEHVIKAVDDLVANEKLADNNAVQTLIRTSTERARTTAQPLQAFLQSHLSHPNHVRKNIRRKLLVKDRKTLKRYAEEIHFARAGVADTLAISTLSHTTQLPTQIKNIQSTINAYQLQLPTHDHSVGTVPPLAGERARNGALENHSMQQKNERISEELIGIRLELQTLTHLWSLHSITPKDSLRTRRRCISGSNGDNSSAFEANSCGSTSNMSDSTDTFYDCLSCFSDDDARNSFDRVRAWISGSPISYFESRSSFFGEQYTTENSVGEIVAAVAMIASPYSKSYSLQRYFIIYAETARLYRRITITAKIPKAPQRSIDAGMTTREEDLFVFEILPLYLYQQLPGLLRQQRLFDTVTEVKLTANRDTSGHYEINVPKAIVTEDRQEFELTNEEFDVARNRTYGVPPVPGERGNPTEVHHV
ncbi:MAG: hypothetical protein Q9222_000707 [Ikaeria aurantiellina]